MSRTAIVIGGGLAGLAAATELAGRGVRVTLVERNQHLGAADGARLAWLYEHGEVIARHDRAEEDVPLPGVHTVRVVVDRPERDVEFQDQEDHTRRFHCRTTQTTSWAPTTVVVPVGFETLKNEETDMSKTTTKKAKTTKAPESKAAAAPAKPAKAKSTGKLSCIDAAAQILAEKKEPMNTKEMIEAMAKAPVLLDYLNAESKEHFEKVKSYLDALGVKYQINPKLVRGFDYYTGTTFEFIHMGLGAQSAIGGGGRYDKLMSELGGQDLSGIGWGLGVDRTILAAEEEGVIPADLGNADLFIIPLGTQLEAIKIAAGLRAAGKVVEIAFGERGLKGAMKGADKSGAKHVVVLGENEVASGSVELKTMSSGDTKSVRISDLVNAL